MSCHEEGRTTPGCAADTLVKLFQDVDRGIMEVSLEQIFGSIAFFPLVENIRMDLSQGSEKPNTTGKQRVGEVVSVALLLLNVTTTSLGWRRKNTYKP